MTNKHTQGEWWCDGLEIGSGPTMQTKIAKASGATREEARANALLISAAPELLEAARAALWEMSNTNAPRNSFTDATDKLDAAISKATGEAQ